MKLSISLAGALLSVGGLAAKEELKPDKVAAGIKTEAWVSIASWPSTISVA